MKNEKLLPGLVDLQVNGFAGVDFNSPGLTAEKVRTVSRRLREEGITAYLPALVTNAPAVMEETAEIILSATDSREADEAKILGLHLEGPFISRWDGARGAHPAEWVCPPNAEWLRRMQDRSAGRIRLVTFSPEWEDSPGFVEEACAMGIRVAIGHTLATREQVLAAVDAGATLSTHLGNGIPPMLPRHPNPLWSQLAEDRLWVSLIGDGFHVSRGFFDTAMKVKQEKAFLVSDCTQFAGMPPGPYETFIGGEVVLTPEGRLHLAADERLLAGSAFSLRRMVDTLVEMGWTSRETAWEMGSVRPWRFLEETEPMEMIEISV